jgi:hypothetical protein
MLMCVKGNGNKYSIIRKRERRYIRKWGVRRDLEKVKMLFLGSGEKFEY